MHAKTGAGDGTRTRDNLLGRQELYQLSYSRQYKTILALKPPFVKMGAGLPPQYAGEYAVLCVNRAGYECQAIDITRRCGLISHLPSIEREVILMQAYCVKCRAKKEMKDAKSITMKNGKPATQGVCPSCGTKMFRIGKS